MSFQPAVAAAAVLALAGTAGAQVPIKQKPKLSSPVVKPVTLAPRITIEPQHKIELATQIFAEQPRVTILIRNAIPNRYRVNIIEWGGLNRTWTLTPKTWTRTSITAPLPPPLHSSIAHLSERYEVALYDTRTKRLVSNKVPLRPARGRHVYLSNVRVYGREILHGRFRLAFDGVNLLPAANRKVQFRLVMPLHGSRGFFGLKRTVALSASRFETWSAHRARSQMITTAVAPPPDFAAMKIYGTHNQRNYWNSYSHQFNQSAYMEIVILDAAGKAISKPVRIRGSALTAEEPPPPDRRVDHDGDGHHSIETGGDDCDDQNNRRYPGNSEIADTSAFDEDCDPATIGKADRDGDGFTAMGVSNLAHYAHSSEGNDCNDRDPTVNPHSGERCNGKDDDCDGTVDDGLLNCSGP